MLNALCLTLALAPQSSLAAEFFPLVPGTKWVYQEEGRFLANTYVDEVLEPVEIKGERAYPIAQSREGKVIDTTYYRVFGEGVYIVAYKADQPLDPPRLVLKVGERRETWEYVGLTPFLNDPIPLKMKGESNLKGRRKVLGRDLECVEVKFEAQQGRTTADLVVSRQTCLYAKGIGLVEMTGKTTIDRSTETLKLKLLEYKPPTP